MMPSYLLGLIHLITSVDLILTRYSILDTRQEGYGYAGLVDGDGEVDVDIDDRR